MKNDPKFSGLSDEEGEGIPISGRKGWEGQVLLSRARYVGVWICHPSADEGTFKQTCLLDYCKHITQRIPIFDSQGA